MRRISRAALAAAALAGPAGRHGWVFEATAEGVEARLPGGRTAFVAAEAGGAPMREGLVAAIDPAVPQLGAGAFLAAAVAEVAAPATRIELSAAAIRAAGDEVVGALRTPTGEWLGFLPARGGAVGVAAVGPDQMDIVAAAPKLGIELLDPWAAAGRLQQMGLAALPARAASSSRAGGEAVRAASGPDLAWPRPLVGVSVLDLGRAVAAPLAARLLARLGADVTSLRPAGEVGATAAEIDLARRDGRDEAARLARERDLVVENYRPRFWTSLELRPRAHLALRGLSPRSRRADWRIFGFLVEACFGVGYVPLRAGGSVRPGADWDRTMGIVGAARALLCLDHRGPHTAAVDQASTACAVRGGLCSEDGRR